MPRQMRKGITALLVVSMVLTPVTASQPTSARDLTRTEYEACQAGDDTAFKEAVQAITATALAAGLQKVDYRAAVDGEWRRVGMSEIIDQRVDISVAEVRKETSWSDLLKSLAYKDVAQKIAVSVTERVYRSDVVKAGIDQLAVGVGKEIASAIEIATIDSSKPALQCIRTFLGSRYGSAVAGVVTRDAGKEFEVDPSKGQASLGPGTTIAHTSEGITGAVILLVRRRLADMARRLGQRLVGSVLGRLVSVVAGGIGVVLIAKDVWEMRSGVLPIIADEMKSAATKEKVKAELANTISDQIKTQMDEIASATAERILEIWREFRRSHQKVLDLAERNSGFRSFLDGTRPQDLARLDDVVGLLLPEEGEGGVLKRLADGTLQRAVMDMPEEAMVIAREKQSIGTAMAWQALAGGDLKQVARYGLHKLSDPKDFTRTSLSRLLGLEDTLAVTRLAEVSRSAREALFELGDESLTRLARNLDRTELDTLAGYLTGLTPAARKQVLTAVAETPARIRLLATPYVRDAVLASKDQQAAVRMMLQSPPVFDLAVLKAHLDLVLSGQVSPILMWEKHPIAIVSGLLLIAMVLLILRRLTMGRRPRPGSGGGRERTA